MIDLAIAQQEVVKQILATYIPELEVWVFGSRASGNPKKYSDLDLAVISNAPLPLRTMALLETDFSESDLPIKVDILDWATTSTAFQRIIKQNYQIIQTAKSN